MIPWTIGNASAHFCLISWQFSLLMFTAEFICGTLEVIIGITCSWSLSMWLAKWDIFNASPTSQILPWVHMGVPCTIWLVFNLLDKNWFRPIPVSKCVEKLVNKIGTGHWGVIRHSHLTNFCHQNSPRCTSKKSQHVTIQAIFLGPKLNNSQGQSKFVHVWNQLKYFTSGSVAIQTPDIRVG